jgi:hypothetical protein
MTALLVEVLRDPARCATLSPADWDTLIPQARNAGLQAALGLSLQDRDLLPNIPAAVRRHLESRIVVHEKQKRDLDYELGWLRRALGEAGEEVILLKGAAYIVAGLPAGVGRMISDIDLLLPVERLPRAEQSLQHHGWLPGDIDPYDDRYYRQWMHEIPPLAHRTRGATIDLHHTILPPTAKPDLDASLLFQNLPEVRPGIRVLAPVDMVLHSAVHLFHEGEFRRGLRDLLDIDRLLRDFAGRDPAFWQALVARAAALDVTRFLFYAVHHARRVYQTPVPGDVVAALDKDAPRFPARPVMDFMFARAFLPDHASCRLPFTGVADFFLYIRSHYLRMPLRLLIPHLLRKAWRSFAAERSSDGAEGDQAVERA